MKYVRQGAEAACSLAEQLTHVAGRPTTSMPAPPAEDRVDEAYAEAFRDLEGHICGRARMSQIAAQYMGNATCDDEELAFAVFHLHEMLLNLKKNYYDAWDGESIATRLITSTARTSKEIKEQLTRTAEAKDETPPPIA